LTCDLLKPWPKCLHLEKLEIFDPPDSCSFEKLVSSITLPVKIVHLEKVAPHQIYTLVEKLGPGITHLTIKHVDEEMPLDVAKVLAACPTISFIDFNWEGPIIKSSNKLKPHHFANYQEYNC